MYIFRLPADSNVMQIVHGNVRRRVNDFFMPDVVKCHRVIKDEPNTSFLKEALKMHLVNTASDEIFFHHSVRDMTTHEQVRLLNLTSNLPNDYELRMQVARAMKESLTAKGLHSQGRLLKSKEAFLLVKSLAYFDLKHPFLWELGTKSLCKNFSQLTDFQKEKLQIVMQETPLQELNGDKNLRLLLDG